MRKINLFCLAAALYLSLLGACAKNGPEDAAAVSAETTAQIATGTSETAAVSVLPSDNETLTASESAQSPETSQAEATPEAVIIAESSNIISDSEKQEILDGLIGELDSTLGSIDSLEDLDDSDLNTDTIE